MTLLQSLLSVLAVVLSLGAVVWIVRRARDRPLSLRWVFGTTLGGALSGALAFLVESRVFSWTGLSLAVTPSTELGAVLAAFLLVAPLEEALKVGVAWPAYAMRVIMSPRTGVVFGVCIGGGFSAVSSVAYLLTHPSGGLVGLRALLGIVAQLFCAALWGYALGNDARTGRRWLSGVWFVAVLVHGLYDHIAFGRGPGMLAMLVPLLAAMGILVWIASREVSLRDTAPSSFLPSLPDPPSLRVMRRALRRSDRGLMLHWIAFGALVNVGVMLACLGLSVYLGHRFGMDFSVADEADMRSNAPLVLLGSAVLVAFPVAGYLVARASGSTSVLEPAMAAAAALAGVVALLSVTAPIALIFALAVAPVAFGLACTGAWFGVNR